MRLFRRISAVFLLYAALIAAGIPTQAQQVTDTVTVGTAPDALAVNPVTNVVYVANDGNDIWTIDGNTDTAIPTPSGEEPTAVAVNPVTNKAYITNSGTGNVSVIDGFGNYYDLVDVDFGPGPIAVNSVTNKIYVGCIGAVTIIDGATDTTTSITVPDYPSAIAVNPVTNKIYASCAASNEIVVIDGATGTITATLPGTSNSNTEIAVNPVTNKVYVTDSGTSKILVVDGATNKLSAPIITSAPATFIAVNPVTNKIYAVTGTTVTAINGVTLAQSPITVGTNPAQLSINPNANTIAVANSGSNSVTVIDGATNSTVTLPVTGSPFAITTNPVTNKIYAATDNDTVSVIDGSSYSAVAYPAGSQPNKVIANPATNKVYAINVQSANVTAIDATSNTTKRITVGRSPNFGAANPITNKVYVVNAQDDTVSVIDGSSDAVTATVNVGTFPGQIALDTLTNLIYVVNQQDDTVSVINGATNTVTATIAVGSEPSGIVVNPVTNKIYVANSGDDDVSVIDGSSNTILKTVATDSNPSAIAVNSVSNKIYVCNFSTNTVTVIDGSDNSTTSVTVGTNPDAIAINTLTNRAYVVNEDQTVTIINGGNGTKSLNVGSFPFGVAVDQIRNKIFVTNYLGNTVSIIDGISNSILTVGTGSNPSDVAVNPITGKAYICDRYSNNVLALSTQPAQPTSLTTAITPLPNNSTNSALQPFTFTTASTFKPTTPTPQHVYYQLDNLDWRWTAATGTSPTFTGTAGDGSHPMQEGLHILYAYADDGMMATSTQVASSFTGAVTAYVFRVGPSAGTHFVLSAPSTVVAGSRVVVAVTAVDENGHTITNYPGTIHFSSDDPSATVPADTTLTNGTGNYTYILKTAKNVALRVRDISSPATTGTATVSVTPEAVSQLAIAAPAKVSAGIAFFATVSALDRYRNIVKSYSGTVHFTSTDAGALLPADLQLTGGSKQVSIKLITAGAQKITVTDKANSALTASVTPTVVLTAAKLVISAPTKATAGAGTTFTVTAMDTVHNVVPGYTGTVHITSSDATATLPLNAKLKNGVGTFMIVFKKAGSQSITATDTIDATITGTIGGIAVSGGTATKFIVSTPASVTASSAFLTTVTAQDTYGNTANAYTGTVHYTSSDPLAVLPANMTLTNGIGRGNLKLKTKGNQTVSATDTAAAGITGTSPAIAVN